MTSGTYGWQVEAAIAGAPTDIVDALVDQLWFHGADAIEERPDVLIAGFSLERDARAAASAIGAAVRAITDESWLDAWRAHARPVTFGDALAVVPAWLTATPTGCATEIHIDPGRCFGAGDHPSTRLVLAQLVERVRGGERVLDVGCGSGVLAIAAVALGAAGADVVDIDAAALEVTRANALRNQVAESVRVAGTWGHEGAAPYEIVAANIGAGVLRQLAPRLVRATGGVLILSGLLSGQAATVIDAFAPLELVACPAESGWEAAVLMAPTM